MTTKYAPAKRASEKVVMQQIELFKEDEVLKTFLSSIPAIFIILNEYRQVVYMNNGALEFSDLEDLSSITGKRPGEVFGCIHHAVEEGGCGTAEACTYCGTLNTVLSSQKGLPSINDCRLTCSPNETPFDLRVWASPLDYKGNHFTAVTIQDISDEKRRGIIEKVFLHDILNSINGIYTGVQLLLRKSENSETDKYLDIVYKYTNVLIEEVRFHQVLTRAEGNDLKLTIDSFNSVGFLNEISVAAQGLSIAKEKKIRVDNGSDDMELTSDRTVLRRIINNMTINALEAIERGGEVLIGCRVNGENIKFWVNNPGNLTKEEQNQIFQRSFSTKDVNRGLGTYSMKLLSRFLKGDVKFSTSKDKGITFSINIPLKHQE